MTKRIANRMEMMRSMCRWVENNCSPANREFWEISVGINITEEEMEQYASDNEEWADVCRVYEIIRGRLNNR